MAGCSCRHLMGVVIVTPDIILISPLNTFRESVSHSEQLQYIGFPYLRNGQMNESYIIQRVCLARKCLRC